MVGSSYMSYSWTLVQHSIGLVRVSHLQAEVHRCRCRVLAMYQEFLTNRRQLVVVNSAATESIPVVSEVPPRKCIGFSFV